MRQRDPQTRWIGERTYSSRSGRFNRSPIERDQVSRGHDRERAVVRKLRDDDWFAMRAPASLGVADIVALRAGSRPRLIEVKSTAGGPYEHFRPTDRAELRAAAELAGADAFLAWWPPRGKLVWLHSSGWPVAV